MSAASAPLPKETSGENGKTLKLEVTPTAVEQIKGLMKSQKAGMGVRVFAQVGGGGCCGGGAPAYGMAFDRPKSGDNVVKVDGVSFLVDPYSLDFLNGAVVEFVKTESDAGFKITNPALPASEHGEGDSCGSGGCGCGSGGCGCG